MCTWEHLCGTMDKDYKGLLERILSVCSHFYFILLSVAYYFILFIEFIMVFPLKGPLSPSFGVALGIIFLSFCTRR